MSLRLAILGLDPIQRDWLDAVAALAGTGEIEIHGIGHRSIAAAKDIASVLKLPGGSAAGARAIPTYDDLRLLLKDAAPQVILLDRPPNVTIDFLLACVEQNIGILSLGRRWSRLPRPRPWRRISRRARTCCISGRGLRMPRHRSIVHRRMILCGRSVLQRQVGWG